MARTTPMAVKDILNRDYDSIQEPPLDGYIETAGAIVDQIIECATRKGVELTSTEQELIERWLSAHFYGVSDQPYKGRSTLRASGQFQGETAMYLEATKYGQMAILLDKSGCLDGLNKRHRVRALWLGRRPSQQTNVEDRD